MRPGFRIESCRLLALLMLICGTALAQNPSDMDARSYTTRRWTRADGLPQDTVLGIDRTPDGYLWIATFGGLARFDGHRFKNLTLNDDSGLVNNRVMAVCASHDGGLYLSSNFPGLFRHSEGRITLVPGTDKCKGTTFIREDGNGTVWFGGTGGIWKLADGEITKVARVGTGMTTDAARNCWAITEQGIVNLTESRALEHPAARDIVDLTFDRRGRLWLASGTRIYCPPANASFDLKELGFSASVRCAHDQAGNCIVYDKRMAIALTCPTTGRGRISMHEPLTAALKNIANPKSFYCGGGDTLWVGTELDGMVRVSPAPFHFVSPVKNRRTPVSGIASTGDRIVMQVLSDKIVDDLGNTLVDNKGIKDVTLIGSTRDGSVWTSYRRAVSRWKPDGTSESFNINVDRINGVVMGDEGAFWFGTYGSVLRYRDGILESVAVDVKRPVTVKLCDADGRLWFFFEAGVGWIKGEEQETFVAGPDAGSPWRDMVQCLDGSFWISTYGRGLFRFKEGKFAQIVEKDGLLDASLAGLVCTRDALWVNSNSGVLRVSLAELNDVIDKKLSRVHCRLFETRESNGATAVCDSNGHIWFPSMHGVTVLDPEKWTPDRDEAIVHIESVLVDREPVARGGAGFAIGPGPHNLEVHYTGISSGLHDQVNFRYRLKGHRDAWTDAGSRRVAYFTDVPPGDYTFEVVAETPDGVWNKTPTSAVVSVAPYFWQTTLFKILAVLSLIGMAYGFIQLKTQSVRMHNAALRQEIEERKRLEEERRQIEKSLLGLRRLEAVGRLAGGIAHDFNNVLTVMMGSSEMLGMSPKVKDDPKLLGHVNTLRECSDRAAALTRQLLAFSRQQVRSLQFIDANEMIENLRPMLSRLIPEDIELTFRLHDSPLTLRTDPSQFEQVVMNLVLNARDAADDGGSIFVETRRLTLDDQAVAAIPGLKPGEHVKLSVVDTGVGMDQETLGRIFEPFFTTKEVNKGTGLGLASVHGIVAQSKGAIVPTSVEGAGTTFHVYFPFEDSESTMPAKSTGKQDRLEGSETILICDDDKDIGNMVVRYLRSHGYNVHAESRPRAALQFAREQEEIDLLITDVVMPESNGAELARAMNNIHPGARVLFVSGYTADVTLEHGVSGEEISFLEKPFDSEKLLRKVREVLDRSPKIS